MGIHERGRDRQGRPQHLGRPSAAAPTACLDRATGQMSGLPSILKFDAIGQAGRELRSGSAHLSARHPRRPRRQRLGDRWPGRCATAGATGAGRCGDPLRSPARIDARPPGLQIQSRRQTADDARQGWGRGGARLLLSTQRRARRAKRRHLRLRGARRCERACAQVRSQRQIHDGLRQQRSGAGRDGASARARDGFAWSIVRR